MVSGRLFFMAALCLVASGCQKYRAQPLQPNEVMRVVDEARRNPDGDAAPVEVAGTALPLIERRLFTFARATELMKKHSPVLREVRAEYETSMARATLKTPLPNPTLEAGPQVGFGPDLGSSSKVTPFASIGFAIPTGRRLKRQDELNQTTAAMAHVEVMVRHRELYLQLRQTYSRLALAAARMEARKSISTSAEKSVGVAKRLIEAGLGTALDQGLLDLEYVRLRTELFSAESDKAAAEGELSQLIGVHADHFATLPVEALPAMSETIPGVGELKEILLLNHPQLARMRARYDVAERELHLEVARQYPDFRIGSPFDREVGERKNTLGLTLGIDIPVFDRNQQSIAQAKTRRDEIRIKYEAAANRALADLERALATYKVSIQKLKMLREIVLPKAQSNIELARKSLEAGATDALRFLETERGQRAVLVQAIETELSVREGWIELEKAIGYPLSHFPTESPETYPQPIPGEHFENRSAESAVEQSKGTSK